MPSPVDPFLQPVRQQLRLLLANTTKAVWALVVLYFVGLAWIYEVNRGQTENGLRNEVLLETEKQATTIGYFFSERHNDIQELAESAAVRNYFSNLDLGMSYEYGLALSLDQVRERFRRLTEQKKLRNKAIYRHILLLDQSANPVIGFPELAAERGALETQLHQQLNMLLTPNSHQSTLLVNRANQEIILSMPVWHHEQYRGQLLAWGDMGGLDEQVSSNTQTVLAALILEKNGTPLLGNAVPYLQTEQLHAHLATQFGPGRQTILSGPASGLPGFAVLVRVPIAHAPLALVSLIPDSLLASRSRPLFWLLGLGLVPLILLVFARLSYLQQQRNQQLAQEKGQLEADNSALEHEISQRKAAEAALKQQAIALEQAYQVAEAANQAKSSFLSKMSHELRTPLHGIQGMLDLLHGEPLNEQQHAYVNTAHHCGDELLALVNNLLTFSSLSSGSLQLKKAPYSPQQIFLTVLSELQEAIEARQIVLDFVLDETLPDSVTGDAEQVAQVLRSLTSNAAKFTAQGMIKLELHWLAGQQTLHFDVRDSGVGIDDHARQHLFESFSQGDDSHTRSHGGTGLGLAMAYRLCEQMGGTLDFASTPGEGSHFWFEIPCPAGA